VHLVDFIIRIYQDVRSPECQNNYTYTKLLHLMEYEHALSYLFFSGKGRHHTIIRSIHSTYAIFSSCSQLVLKGSRGMLKYVTYKRTHINEYKHAHIHASIYAYGRGSLGRHRRNVFIPMSTIA